MKFLRYFEKQFEFVGLDLGEDELKAIQFDMKDRSIKTTFSCGSGENFSQFGFKRENLEKALMELSKSIPKSSNTRFNVSLPAQFTVPKKIRVPETAQSSDILGEIANQVPFSLDSVYFDYVLRKTGEGTIAVFLAVKRDIVDFLVSLMSNAGLSLGVVETEYFSTYNALEFCFPQVSSQVIIMIHLNPSYTVFAVSHFGIPISCSESRFGYKTVFEDLLIELGLDWSGVFNWIIGKTEAEIKINQTRFMDTISFLTEEVCKNLNLLKHLPELEEGVDSIYVCGPLAHNRRFCAMIQDKLGIETVGFNPFPAIKSDLDAGFTRALGASLRRFGDKYD
ncbi:MAG: pilus assembly protein PilM [Deltaproteobacteria bacterium]|nr:pilus assembly protein PilM [Deltaproteobacteria bacterium]MCX7952835.1 pilus assembly protein PilM [Deltaproteobacteria bacterium]